MIDSKKNSRDDDENSLSEKESFYDRKAEEYVRREFERTIKSEAMRAHEEGRRAMAAAMSWPAKSAAGGRAVRIKIRGKQWGVDDKEEEIIIDTSGNYYKKNDKHYLAYRETDGSGMGSTLTTLVYNQPGDITLKRTGDTSMKIHFVAGRKEISSYNTAFGKLNLGFFTNKAEFKIHSKGGRFNLEYKADVSIEAELHTSLNISFSFIGQAASDSRNVGNA